MIHNVFISYSTVDTPYKDAFKKHLKALEMEQLIKIWDGDLVKIGADWDSKIKEKIKSTDILIVLLSPDAVISEYINEVELKIALKSQKKIFPILLKPCNWLGLSISRYQCLPKGARPISSFKDKDSIYSEIVSEIRATILQGEQEAPVREKLHHVVDHKLLSYILSSLKTLLHEVIRLMERIPLKEEKRGEAIASFLDVAAFEEEIFRTSLEYITIRNQILDELEMLDDETHKAIEDLLENIFSYVTMNRVGHDVGLSDWKRIFREELLITFNVLLKKSLNV